MRPLLDSQNSEQSQDYVPSVTNSLCSHTGSICVDLLGDLLEERFACALGPSGEILSDSVVLC